jgi:hypothetical protein
MDARAKFSRSVGYTPITITAVADQLSGLTLVKDSVTKESLIDAVNTLTTLHLEASEDPAPLAPGAVNPVSGTVVPDEQHQKDMHAAELAQAQATAEATAAQAKASNVIPMKKKTAMDIVDLAEDYAALKGLTRKRDFTPTQTQRILDEVKGLSPMEDRAFNTLLASLTYGSADPDLVHIAGCAHKH